LKKYITFTILVTSLFNYSYAQKFQKEGLVHYYDNLVTRNNTTPIPVNRIWFKDSCIIYERKVINRTEDHTITGVVIKNSYDIYKSSFLDLRTLKCQDYYNLSDTAQPFSNYILKPDDALGWNFYYPFEKTNDKMIAMPDTIIERQNFKRIRRVVPNHDNWYEILFLTCNKKKNIFHIYKNFEEKLEKKYPYCKVTRSELTDLNFSFKRIFQYFIVREKLNSLETKIFNKWILNSATTTLPIISLFEVNKLPIKKI
jgi:hypothetical protein